MKKEVNNCCDCANDTYPCIGDACPLKHCIEFYCDNCDAEETLYDISGVTGEDGEFCEDCAKTKIREYVKENLEELISDTVFDLFLESKEVE